MSWTDEAGRIVSLAATISQKVVDDSLRHNAENATGAGLEVRVSRTYDGVGLSNGRVCQWCKDRECREVTLREAYDIGAFQRHDGCECIIEYTSTRGIRTYQSGKSGPQNWLSETEFQKRAEYGLDKRKVTVAERIINAAIEMQTKDKRSHTLVNALIEHHDALKHYTPQDMVNRLVRAGFNVEPLSQSKSGFNGKSVEEGGGFKVLFGGDGIFRYHPKGGRHKIEYWTVANSAKGEHRYGMDGQEVFVA